MHGHTMAALTLSNVVKGFAFTASAPALTSPLRKTAPYGLPVHRLGDRAGRSPGSRVVAFIQPSQFPSGRFGLEARRLQLRGQPRIAAIFSGVRVPSFVSGFRPGEPARFEMFPYRLRESSGLHGSPKDCTFAGKKISRTEGLAAAHDLFFLTHAFPAYADYVPMKGPAMTLTRALRHIGLLAAAALLVTAVGLKPLHAMGTDSPNPPSDDSSKKKKKKNGNNAIEQQQQQQEAAAKFLRGYRAAREMILAGNYQGGIAAMHALGHDEHADVANYIGYAYRKLGDYKNSQVWYEAALKTDPNHVRTWSYYGMWQAEQGNRLKALDDLQKVKLICGNADVRRIPPAQGRDRRQGKLLTVPSHQHRRRGLCPRRLFFAAGKCCNCLSAVYFRETSPALVWTRLLRTVFTGTKVEELPWQSIRNLRRH